VTWSSGSRTSRDIGLVVALVGCCAALVAGASAAPSALPQQFGVVDLLTQANVEIVGAARESVGSDVAPAGDVNGDGLEDLIVGASRADNNERQDSGSAYVVFGRPELSSVNLGNLGTGGFRVDGAAGGDGAGWSVAGVGDVNGDGRDDVVVGAFTADNRGRENSGSAYVVFGKASSERVDLAALGEGGYRIDGAAPRDLAGFSVAGTPDINGDRRPDVLLTAPNADNNERTDSGSAYVVFGKASSDPVDLAALGSQGFRVDGAAARDMQFFGFGGGGVVAAAGDVNGDGRPDVIVGTQLAGTTERALAGAAYVVFGKASSSTVDLAALEAGGFRIEGAVAGDQVGRSVAGVGDVNGDGLADVALGAPFLSTPDRQRFGTAYVVFGKASHAPVDLAALGVGGFLVRGSAAEDRLGTSVAGLGDVNGDGRPDVGVGATGTDNNGREDSGSSYVLFGRDSSAPVDVSALSAAGIRIDGPRAVALAGGVAAGGDLNGDGRADVAVGMPSLERVAVVFGFGEPQLAYGVLSSRVGQLERHGPSRLERTGTPSFRVSPPLPAGMRLEGLGVVTGTPTQAQSRSVHEVTMTDLAGAVTAELVVEVSALPDRTPPLLRVAATSPQRALRQRAVRMSASCNEPCSLRAQGAIAGSAIRIPLRPAAAPLAAGRQRTLVLSLTPAAQQRLARLLAQGRRARALVTVRAVDRSGNARTVTRVVAVR
jgi:hypothetical protein